MIVDQRLRWHRDRRCSLCVRMRITYLPRQLGRYLDCLAIVYNVDFADGILLISRRPRFSICLP